MDMQALCATWVESLFGADAPPFEARFSPRKIGISAVFTLSESIEAKVRSVAGRRGVPSVSGPEEAAACFSDEARRRIEQHIENLRRDPDYQSAILARQPLSSYGVVTTCRTCNGSGRMNCAACNGTGWVACSICQGRGTAACGGCGGAGNKSVPVQNASGFTYVTCGRCGGGGRVMCYCAGTGRSICSCQAGKVPCTNCAATGVRSTIHSAVLVVSVARHFWVAEAPDDFIAESARAAPEAISTYTRLVAPGERRPGGRAVAYRGECAIADGVFTLAGRSARVLGIGAPSAAVAADRTLDDVCDDYRRRLEEAAGGELPALLAFADGNRLAATQILVLVKRRRPRTMRAGIERRGFRSQGPAENKLTEALLSHEFRDSCLTAAAGSIDRHVAVFKAQLHAIYSRAIGRFLIGASIGLLLLLLLALLPPASRYRADHMIQLLYLGWCTAVGLVFGTVAAIGAIPVHRAEFRLLSTPSGGTSVQADPAASRK